MNDILPFDVIITSENPMHLQIATEAGYLRGTSLTSIDRIVNGGEQFEFLDINWESPNYSKLLTIAQKYIPKYCVAGDYSISSENIAEVNSVANQLLDYCENVIIVPHSVGQVDEVPEECLVGYSAKSTYNSTAAKNIEYMGRDIHVLGGGPGYQLELLEIFGNDIVSMDGNNLIKLANIAARYWTQSGQRFVSYSTPDRLDECLKRSLMHFGYAVREQMDIQRNEKSVLDY